jgi:hypothetical protein
MANTFGAKLDDEIAIKLEILDTYEGMASVYDGESAYPAHIFDRIDELEAEIAYLKARRAEVMS